MLCGYCKTPDVTVPHVRDCASLRWGAAAAEGALPPVPSPAPSTVQVLTRPRPAVVPFREQVAAAKRDAAARLAATAPAAPDRLPDNSAGHSPADEVAMLARRREAAARLTVPSARTASQNRPAAASEVLVGDAGQAAPEVAHRGRTSAQRLGINPKTVPGSKYAVVAEDGSGVTEFYKVEVPDKGKWAGFRFVVRLTGAPQGWTKHPLHKAEQVAVLARVAAASYVDAVSGRRLLGPEAAAVRYARTFERCAVCESTLRPASVLPGVDPVCGQRFAGTYGL